jgi:predicted Zn-dependent peptidase
MYHKTALDNGVRIISERVEHLRSVSLGIWVNTGSRDETRSENGVSHFIEHMSFKGTRHRDVLQIAKELDIIGGLSNAFTGKENTCFHGRVLGRHFGRLAEILSDIFLNSTFNALDLEREREVILQEICMMEDTPDDNLHTLFTGLFWDGHPIGWPILGTGETVSAISKETILNYIQKSYIPEEILVVAAGEVDHSDMVSFFKPLFETLSCSGENRSGRSAPVSQGGFSTHHKVLEQVHICLGGRAPSQLDEKRFACAIFNTILGGNMSSRLFQEIREKRGLAYSVYSFLSTYVDAGLLGIYAATEPKHLNLVLQTIRNEIVKLCRGELSNTEVAEAKEHLIGGIYLGSESADNRMMRMAKNEFAFGRYVDYEELVSGLEQVSMDDVVAVARSTFQERGISFAALGPVEKDSVDSDLLIYEG